MRTLASYLRIIVFALVAYYVLDWIGNSHDQAIFEDYPWVWYAYGFLVLFFIAGEVFLAAIHQVLYQNLSEEAKIAYQKNKEQNQSRWLRWFKKVYKNLTQAKPVEEEKDIVFDHEYDGIRELDNKLPPWWIYGFYLTMIFAAVYLVRFSVMKDYTQEEEYEMQEMQAQMAIAEWKKTAKDLIDSETVEELTEAADLDAGKEIFLTQCAVCHKADGGGSIGPNLTDAHWIFGGDIKSVFNVVAEGGRDGKGMIAWKGTLKPLEMAQVSSYILTLQGSNPPEAKAPEGSLWNAEE